MAEKKRTPDIRFEGFSGEWDERKLGEVTDVFDGTHQTPEYTNSGVVFLSVENIKTLYSEKFISEEDFNNEFKIFPEKGDVLMTRIGDIGTANIIESDTPVAYYVSLALLKKKELDPYFLKASISSESTKAELWHRTLHIAFPKKINKNEIEKVLIIYPADRDEQAQIGSFFSTLDKLIALQQRKYDKTVNMKKACLEKMFPKKGAKVPEVRFAGFSGAWEERKFDVFFDCSISNNTLPRSNLNYESGEVRNIHYGDILVKYGTSVSVVNDGLPFISNGSLADYRSRLLQDGDIVLADTAEDETVGKAIEISESHASSAVAGLHTIVCRPNMKMQPLFLGYYMNSYSYRYQLLPLMQGVKVLSLSKRNLSKTLLLSPVSPYEQTKIGEYFRQLDTLITLYSQELKKLKNIKKAFLEKMFI